ncbi:organic anion transporter 3-like [Babylonia areolata]|uniref:organic anion transporter 3-like n=1 Tax=Babylonia areolata TaxID=304850 RepID=UPI003FD0BCC8
MSRSDEKRRVDLDSILEHLGGRSRYQVIQLMLDIFPCVLGAIAVVDIVFTGYKPDHKCSQVENITQVEAYLPDDITNFTLHDIQYHQCSIDVTVNTSGTSSTHSLPCVAGVNFSMPSYTSFVTEWSLVCDKAGLAKLTQSGVFGGQLLGDVVSAILADRYGRKKVYMAGALVAMVCLFGMALIHNYYFFLVCRITAGFFAKAMVRSSYTMFMELIDREWRSTGSVISGTMWAGGCVFMAIVAYCLQGVSWRYLSLAFYSLYVFSLLLPWLLDESLRWLLATGNIQEAERILKKACRMNGKNFEKIQTLLKKPIFPGNNFDDRDQSDSSPTIIQITNSSVMRNDKNKEDTNGDELNDEETADISAERRGSGSDQRDPEEGGPGNDSDEGSSQQMPETEVFSAKYTVLDLFRHRVVLVPLFVVTLVWVTSNLLYYVVILGSAKLSGNRFLNFGLLSLQEIPATFVALFFMRRFNRRPLACIYGLLGGSFTLISVGLATLGGGQGVTMTLATVAQYVSMFAVSGSFCLLFVFYMEVFPTTMRTVGTGAGGMTNNISNMGAPFLLLWAEETPWAPGVMVGCLCCLAGASIWLLPETRHRKLPDTIEEMQAWTKEVSVV